MLSQAKMLVERLKSVVDVDNKWKFINFFIGGNDLCEACKNVSIRLSFLVLSFDDYIIYLNSYSGTTNLRKLRKEHSRDTRLLS